MKVEFLDAGGQVLRTFTGTPKADPNAGLPPGVDPEAAAFFGLAPARVGVAKGMNRFTWDMRYEGATVFPGMIMWAAQPQRGPAAPPGELHRAHHGQRRDAAPATSRSASTRASARDGITLEDLREQFALSARIRDKVTEANTAVITIRALRDQVNERLQKISPRAQGRDPEAGRRASSRRWPRSRPRSTRCATAAARTRSTTRSCSTTRSRPWPAWSRAPTTSRRRRATRSSTSCRRRSTAQLAKMRQTVATDLPRLNSALAREKMPAVDPGARPATPPTPPRP